MTAGLGELRGSIPACMTAYFRGFGGGNGLRDYIIVVNSVRPERELSYDLREGEIN